MPTTLTARSAPPRAAVVLLGLLLVSLAARLVFSVWEGPFEGSVTAADAARPGYWWMNLYVGGPGYTVSFVATAVFLVLLGRGTVLAWVSALLVGLGGVVFGLVITAEVLPFVLAVDPAVLPAEQGRDLVDALNGRMDLLLPTILGSMAVIAVGAVLGLLVAWRARTTPPWFPPAALSAVVASQLLPTVPGYLLETAVTAAIGWFGTRVATG
ncbi:hypothetical protein [Klenkia taihuensis]|uniref:Uncharacterized protein n=1 Tax=Klenkia taihuensis TaxID=1225127 RepID=A0A1I1PYP7_9ACTN|nr:hypothetical protein [Klenkia taihuensis]GHE08325.1 hypothetical protein GCM10011381_08660 [Klenkia taihuensis]SFD14837.1 hypothetical protein SAMN05661030_2508 [Klenkia taihuensis]